MANITISKSCTKCFIEALGDETKCRLCDAPIKEETMISSSLQVRYRMRKGKFYKVLSTIKFSSLEKFGNYLPIVDDLHPTTVPYRVGTSYGEIKRGWDITAKIEMVKVVKITPTGKYRLDSGELVTYRELTDNLKTWEENEGIYQKIVRLETDMRDIGNLLVEIRESIGNIDNPILLEEIISLLTNVKNKTKN